MSSVNKFLSDLWVTLHRLSGFPLKPIGFFLWLQQSQDFVPCDFSPCFLITKLPHMLSKAVWLHHYSAQVNCTYNWNRKCSVRNCHINLYSSVIEKEKNNSRYCHYPWWCHDFCSQLPLYEHDCCNLTAGKLCYKTHFCSGLLSSL